MNILHPENAMFAKYLTDMTISRQLYPFILTIACLICIHSSSSAQADLRLGNWNSVFLKGKLSPKFSLMGEGHIRSNDYNLKYDYYEVKAGIAYLITKNLAGLIGTGLYNTYETGELFETPALQREFRTWLELSFKQAFSRFYLDHRARLEQRFIPDNYKNRFKYRLALTLPVNMAVIDQGCIYLAVNDELFMPQHGVVVEKNRLYGGLGYKLNKNAALQVGCVFDTDYKPNYHTAKNFLQFALFYDFSNLIQKKHS